MPIWPACSHCDKSEAQVQEIFAVTPSQAQYNAGLPWLMITGHARWFVSRLGGLVQRALYEVGRLLPIWPACSVLDTSQVLGVLCCDFTRQGLMMSRQLG